MPTSFSTQEATDNGFDIYDYSFGVPVPGAFIRYRGVKAEGGRTIDGAYYWADVSSLGDLLYEHWWSDAYVLGPKPFGGIRVDGGGGPGSGTGALGGVART